VRARIVVYGRIAPQCEVRIGPISIAVVFLMTTAASITAGVFVDRWFGLGAWVVACGVALPLSILALSPLLGKEDEGPQPSRAAGVEVECGLTSRLRQGGNAKPSYVARPDSCRPARAYERTGSLSENAIVAGRSLRIVPNAVQGLVESASIVDGRPQLVGWGASVARGRAASAILFFAGRRFQGAVKPTVPRPDVVKAYHRSGLRLAGFRVVLPAPLDRGNGLQIFAIDREVASPLRIDCTNPRVKVVCRGRRATR
jgi:hypothetical protein